MSILHRHVVRPYIPSVGAVLEFDALTFDPSTYEVLAVAVGIGGLTEGRASSMLLLDHEGVHREFKNQEPGVEGGRVVRNLFAGPTDIFNTETVTVAPQREYRVSMEGTGSITISSAASETITGEAGKRKCSGVLTAATTSLVCTVSGTVTNAQCEDVTGQSNKNPGEYVSVGVEAGGHGIGIDGLKVFANTNGNTVASGVVTEAVGPALAEQPWFIFAPAATNLVRYSQDLTDPSWTAFDVTVAQDYEGIDGMPNGACTLTATAANATVINEAVVSASDTHATAWHIKRKTGTGAIELTVDGGATWQDITSQVGIGWLRITVDQAAVTDPRVGIRLITDTDAVYVGNAECYKNTKVVASVSPPIFTNGASVSRAACALSFDVANHVDESGMYFYRSIPGANSTDTISGNSAQIGITTTVSRSIAYLSFVGNRLYSHDETAFAFGPITTWASDIVQNLGLVYGDSKRELCHNGDYGEIGTYDGDFRSSNVFYINYFVNITTKMNTLRRYSGDHDAMKTKLTALMTEYS